ncbi:MAG: hypothetical protein AB8B71_10190 [Paracoccaceae bacterium]
MNWSFVQFVVGAFVAEQLVQTDNTCKSFIDDYKVHADRFSRRKRHGWFVDRDFTQLYFGATGTVIFVLGRDCAPI